MPHPVVLPRSPVVGSLFALSLALGTVGVGGSRRAVRADDAREVSFPAAWIGRWTGEATNHPTDGAPTTFAQELEIAQTSIPGRFSWTLRFDGAAGRQERRYFLVASEALPGRYTVEEGGGVDLEATWLDGTLFSQFEVGGHRITSRNRVEGAGTGDERMTTELVTTLAAKGTTVGSEAAGGRVTTWPVANVQSAVLRRRTGAAKPLGIADPDLERLANWMTGEFTSAAQAKADPEYRDIRLSMARIWSERSDGPWLYVEQATAAALDRPYRQRVYRLVHPGGAVFESEVYALRAPADAIGAARDVSKLAAVTPASLEPLEGCTVVLRRIDATTFRGSTLGSACTNTFGGAAFATSEVTLTESGIRSWDRGYDGKAAQVWGATKGGYEFARASTPSAPESLPPK